MTVRVPTSPNIYFCTASGKQQMTYVLKLVMQRYIVQTIYRVDIGHIVSYWHRQEKYRNFDISISFQYRRSDVDVVYFLILYSPDWIATTAV